MTAPRATPASAHTPRATPLARRLAQSRGLALETLSPSSARGSRQGTIKADDVLDALENISPKENGDTRLFASPRARARAKEEGIDIALLQGKGSGPQGRVVQQDVEQALKQGLQQGLQQGDVQQGDMAAQVLPLDPPFELRPHTTMREVIAERLTLSKRTIPHFTLTVACQIDALLSLREQINGHFYEQHHRANLQKRQDAKQDAAPPKSFKVSLNDLMVKALALSFEACSQEDVAVNVAWTDEGMKHFQRVDVAVAVAIPGGLVTPIVRDAATKPLVVLARELHTLIARARRGKLQPQDYTGGTVSISNLGMFGIHAFQAIVNPPQSAILAIGAAEKVLAKTPSNEIVEKTRLYATLSADHRAIDGAAAAQLCRHFKKIVEKPALLLLDHKNVM